jgi:hypothetical protein
MTRSVIEPSPVRHASLALDAYVQFTSPIRRYSDILAHFNLKVRGVQRSVCFPGHMNTFDGNLVLVELQPLCVEACVRIKAAGMHAAAD